MVKRHFLSLQHNYYDMPIQKFTLYRYVKEEYELLEYVSLLAQIYTPDFDFEEESQQTYELPSSAPEIFKVRYNNGLLKIPFTYSSYVKNSKIVSLLHQLQLDCDKFWYLLLFVHDYCRGQFANGWECSLSPLEELQIFSDSILEVYSKETPMDTVFDAPVELTLKIGGKKVITMQNNRTISYLASLCHEQLDTVEYNSQLTTSHVFPSKNVSFSSAIVAYFFANMIIRFFDSQKNIVAKRGKKTKGISDKEKRLISNLIYYTGILVNQSLLDSCDYIKVILRRYKDTPINTFNSIYM